MYCKSHVTEKYVYVSLVYEIDSSNFSTISDASHVVGNIRGSSSDSLQMEELEAITSLASTIDGRRASNRIFASYKY